MEMVLFKHGNDSSDENKENQLNNLSPKQN